MTTHPLPDPDILRRLPLGYEEDPTMELTRLAFFRRSPAEVELFVRARGFEDVQVISEPFGGPNGCYLLRRMHLPKPPLIEDTRKIRSYLATHIGLDPAAFYTFLPDLFDRDFLRIYRYSFTTLCQHGRRHCIRPSHLIPCTYKGIPFRP